MASNICSKLNKKKSKSVADKSKFPRKAGMYMIGEKTGKKFKRLYMGQTNDIKRRINEHLYHDDQAIDRKLKRIKTSAIAVKYETEKKPRRKEAKYIKCMEKIMNKPLPYNKIGGISAKQKRRKNTKSKRKGKK